MELSEVIYNMAAAQMTKEAGMFGDLRDKAFSALGGSTAPAAPMDHRDTVIQMLRGKLDEHKAKKEQKKSDKNSLTNRAAGAAGTVASGLGAAAGSVMQGIAAHPAAVKAGLGGIGGGLAGTVAGGLIGGMPGMAIGGLMGAHKGYNAMRTPSMGEQIMSTLKTVAPHVLQFMEAKKRMDAGHQGPPSF